MQCACYSSQLYSVSVPVFGYARVCRVKCHKGACCLSNEGSIKKFNKGNVKICQRVKQQQEQHWKKKARS